jgi:hypothetical protein
VAAAAVAGGSEEVTGREVRAWGAAASAAAGEVLLFGGDFLGFAAGAGSSTGAVLICRRVREEEHLSVRATDSVNECERGP